MIIGIKTTWTTRQNGNTSANLMRSEDWSRDLQCAPIRRQTETIFNASFIPDCVCWSTTCPYKNEATTGANPYTACANRISRALGPFRVNRASKDVHCVYFLFGSGYSARQAPHQTNLQEEISALLFRGWISHRCCAFSLNVPLPEAWRASAQADSKPKPESLVLHFQPGWEPHHKTTS